MLLFSGFASRIFSLSKLFCNTDFELLADCFFSSKDSEANSESQLLLIHSFQLSSILSTFPVIGIFSKSKFLPLKEYSNNKGISDFLLYSS
jgi:hypothetical protein